MRLEVVPAQLAGAARAVGPAQAALESLRVPGHLRTAMAAVPGGRLAVVAGRLADSWTRELRHVGAELGRHAVALAGAGTSYVAADSAIARAGGDR